MLNYLVRLINSKTRAYRLSKLIPVSNKNEKIFFPSNIEYVYKYKSL